MLDSDGFWFFPQRNRATVVCRLLLKLNLYGSSKLHTCLLSVITAAEELIEYLRSENAKLCEQANDLKTEMNSLRHAFSSYIF